MTLFLFMLIYILNMSRSSFSFDNNHDPRQLFCFECLQNKTIGQNLPKPRLHCRDEDSLTFIWNLEEGSFYAFEYKSQISSNSETVFSNTTNEDHITIYKLHSGTNYRVRMWSFSENMNVYNRSKFFSAKTMIVRTSPHRVKNLHVVTQQLANHSYFAVVKWTPDNDLPCYYEVSWNSESTFGEIFQKNVKIKDPIRYTEVNLTKLELNTVYTVSVRSTTANGLQESAKVDKTFKTPTCIEIFKSLEKCIPDIPTEFKTEEIFINQSDKNENIIYTFDIKLSWLLPTYTPDYYTLLIFTSPLEDDKPPLNFTIWGNLSETIIHHLDLRGSYRAHLTAWSKIGPSETAFVQKEISGFTALVMEEPSASNYGLLGIVTLCIIGIVGTGLAVCVFIKRRRAKQERLKSGSQYFKKPSLENQAIIIKPIFDKWEINPSSLLLKEQVGEGAFGIVRKAYFYKNNAKYEVAVKMLKDAPTKEQVDQLYTEIKIMKFVPKHQNLVSLIGVVTKNQIDSPYLIVEYCSKGDLLTCLKKAYDRLGFFRSADWVNNICGNDPDENNCDNSFYIQDWTSSDEDYFLNAKTLISVARQICCGMEHLGIHKVIHRDLAARNILINKDRTIKVSDFGLSREVYKSDVYLKTTGGKLPFRWMALESITHQRYTTESDIWSFGIVLWEIVSLGRTPYPTIQTNELLLLLEHDYRMRRPENCSNELYDIMRNCWHRNPKKRPTFSSLKKNFEIFLENQTEYLNLDVQANLSVDNYQNVKNSQLTTGKTTSYSEYLKPVTETV